MDHDQGPVMTRADTEFQRSRIPIIVIAKYAENRVKVGWKGTWK
jgi:hypothetical protein